MNLSPEARARLLDEDRAIHDHAVEADRRVAAAVRRLLDADPNADAQALARRAVERRNDQTRGR